MKKIRKNLAILTLALFGLGVIGNNVLLGDEMYEAPPPGGGGGDAPYCHAGGPGATSCSISAGITIAGFGVTAGCSVSCSNGYYACCTLSCTCVSS